MEVSLGEKAKRFQVSVHLFYESALGQTEMRVRGEAVEQMRNDTELEQK